MKKYLISLHFKRRASSLVNNMFASLLCEYAVNGLVIFHEFSRFISARFILPTETIQDDVHVFPYVYFSDLVCLSFLFKLTDISDRRNVDYSASRSGRLHSWQQQQRQKKMPEIIGLQLQFEFILGLLVRRHHHASVVYQQMNGRFCRQQMFGAFSYARQLTEIQITNCELADIAVALIVVPTVYQGYRELIIDSLCSAWSLSFAE